MSPMISIAQLAWKFDFLLRLFSTLISTIVRIICITLPFPILLFTLSLILPIIFFISFGVIGLDDVYRRRLGR